MAMRKARLDRVGNQVHFRHWLRMARIFATMTADELEDYAVTGILIARPEPAFGMSPLDSMDRASLIKLWKENLEMFAGRRGSELEFYAVHGDWPENCFEQWNYYSFTAVPRCGQ